MVQTDAQSALHIHIKMNYCKEPTYKQARRVQISVAQGSTVLKTTELYTLKG